MLRRFPSWLIGRTPSPLSQPADAAALVHGFVTVGLEAAFAAACARLRVTAIEPPFRSRLGKSCGAPVQSADGTRRWLKVTGIPAGTTNRFRDQEWAFNAIGGLPKPAVVGVHDWVAAGVCWRALETELSGSPVASRLHFGRELPPISQTWIGSLRAAVRQLALLEASHFCVTPQDVARENGRRFGRDALCHADEWQVAHGDLNWTNLTAPELMLLDGETWGLAPRGYDLAYLVVNTGYDPNLMERLESAFAAELRTRSGRVAQLFACARMLDFIEGQLHDTAYRRRIEDVAARAIAGW